MVSVGAIVALLALTGSLEATWSFSAFTLFGCAPACSGGDGAERSGVAWQCLDKGTAERMLDSAKPWILVSSRRISGREDPGTAGLPKG